jgi:GAF domain-containing protein
MSEESRNWDAVLQELRELRKENASLSERLRLRNEELDVLNALGQALSATYELGEILNKVYTEVSQLFDTRNFYIALYEEGSSEWLSAYHVVRGERQPPERYSVASGLTGHIIRHREPLYLPNLEVKREFREAQGIKLVGEEARSWMGVPLLAGEQVVGVMAIENYEHENLYTEQDLELFITIASQIATAVASSRLLSETRKRAVQLQTAAEVSRAATSILVLDELLPRAVDLIKERFDLYYTGIFLVEESGRWAVLRAGTGEAGDRMMERGHRLAVGGASMIGRAVGNSKAYIALDVGDEAQRFDNPFLPETRSEMALPLVYQDRAIGAMTIQSAEPMAFSEEDSVVLQAMADQLANSIENARLFREMQANVRQLEAAYGTYTRESWRDLLEQAKQLRGYRYRGFEVEPAHERSPEVEAALAEGRVVRNDGGDGLVVPIKLRDQVIGVVDLHSRGEELDAESVAFAEQVADRLSLALEATRLLEDTRERAARERMVGDITSRVRAEVEVEALLQRALDELGQALDARRATVELEVRE